MSPPTVAAGVSPANANAAGMAASTADIAIGDAATRSEAADETLPRRLRGRFFFHVGVKDGLPLTFHHPPDRTGIVSPGRVLAFRRRLDLRLISNDGRPGIRKDDIEIAQVERFHFRL